MTKLADVNPKARKLVVLTTRMGKSYNTGIKIHSYNFTVSPDTRETVMY